MAFFNLLPAAFLPRHVHFHLRARGFNEWSRAREYWDRAIEQMKLALDATDPDERKRLIAIAQHYRELAEATERSADRKGAERRGEK